MATAATMALLAAPAPAHAQGQVMQMGKAKAPLQQSGPSPQEIAKKKADDKAYQDALRKIPDATEKVDPWKNMR
jgi:hypothetical protein